MGTEYKLDKFAAFIELTKKERVKAQIGVSECTTKIMNTTSFRKLAGKTQVILSLSGPDVRTRLTHTIEVAKMAKAVSDVSSRSGLLLHEQQQDRLSIQESFRFGDLGFFGKKRSLEKPQR